MQCGGTGSLSTENGLPEEGFVSRIVLISMALSFMRFGYKAESHLHCI